MLKIHSIFESISGETGIFEQGSWCTFIRLQGCNHNCDYCDIPEAQTFNNKYHNMEISSILKNCHTEKVIITGGEPLLQDDVKSLLTELRNSNHKVQIETNGSIFPLPLPYLNELTWVVDIKTPCAGEANKQTLDPQIFAYNFIHTVTPIYFKFVINSKDDILFSIPYIKELMKIDHYNEMKIDHYNEMRFAFSPLFTPEGEVNYNLFRNVIHILDNKMLDKTICSLQIHKLIDFD